MRQAPHACGDRAASGGQVGQLDSEPVRAEQAQQDGGEIRVGSGHDQPPWSRDQHRVQLVAAPGVAAARRSAYLVFGVPAVPAGQQHRIRVDRAHPYPFPPRHPVDGVPPRCRRLECHMPAIVLIGAQWGDEGKGKATDLLGDACSGSCATRAATTPGTPWCCPTAGLRAAPHSVGHPHPRCQNVIGNGVVVDPGVLLTELDGLEDRGVDTERLLISADAHLLMPYHVDIDKVTERFLGKRRSARPAAASARVPGQGGPDRHPSGRRARREDL